MSTTQTYKLTLLDGISAPLRKVTGASDDVIGKLSELSATQKKFEGINNSLGGSIASLRAKMEMLRSEKELISPANTAEVKKYNVEIEKLGDKIARLDNVGSKNQLVLLNASAFVNLAQSTADGIANISQVGIGFEQGVADLSAITGIAGKDLDKLSSTARKVGAESGLGASQAVEAYKLLASQIDVSKIGLDGLQELQKRTITLSQAGGLSMADAANAMAGTINQFGLEASEASRIINVLAAGSKYGAAEIPELAQSFKVVGAAASAAGLNVESTAGAIEVLSKNNLKGAEAGTALRNIVLKMQTTLGYDFSKTSLSDALADLTPKMSDAAYMSKVFGMENMAAAQFLVANAGAVQEMTDRVTDSNVAQEQAAIRTNTVQATMDRCRAKVDNLKIGIFNLIGASAGYATIFSEQAVTISQMIPLIMMLGKVISIITNIETLRTIATNVSTAATKVATGAMWLFNAALNANPIMKIVVVVSALAGIVALCWNKFEGFREAVYGIWGVVKEFGKSLIDSVVNPFKQVLNGIGGVCSAIVNLVKGNFQEAAAEAKAGLKDIGLSVVNGNPIGIAYNTAKGGDYKAAWQDGTLMGRDSWAMSQAKNKVEVGTQEINVTEPTIIPSIKDKVSSGSNSISDISTNGATGQILDLNDYSDKNSGNSTTSASYLAATNKIPKMASRVAASIALPAMLATSSPALAQPKDDYMTSSSQTTQMMDENRRGRTYQVEKVCDQVVIYIQNTDDKGAETIKEEILKILNELGDE
ncbi:MAG: phage tail tape measure protein [Rikenellaceae bacterium]